MYWSYTQFLRAGSIAAAIQRIVYVYGLFRSNKNPYKYACC